MDELRTLQSDFANPPATFRGAPFWAWNGKLEPDELRRQIRIFNQMGLGGFFMHSRVGLNTEYLSKEWFRCIKTCQNEAAKYGMKAYFYDEDRWPSGAAGGKVTQNHKFRASGIYAVELSPGEAKKYRAKKILLAIAAAVNGRTLSQLKILKSPCDEVPPEHKVIVFERRVARDENYFNGEAALDTMNPKAVKRFIEITYDQYYQECKKSFGNVSPAIFTDEPSYLHFSYDGSLPWTPKLPKVFQKRFGEEIIPRLPELFYDVKGVDSFRLRWQYIECVTKLFVNSFAKTIGKWCAKHGIDFTGHVLYEDSLIEQTCRIGSAMRFYEYMQLPGMDLLTEHARIYDTAKQVSSAARQFDCSRRLSETYGCTGWDFSFAGHKALGDWQLALGINLRCQHLSYYTMAAEAKRDYPASISYQSPWHSDYKTVEDYFARLTGVLTKGKEIRDILVIHPVESVWGQFRTDLAASKEAKSFEQSLIKLRDNLLQSQLDFDYGDEDILSRHGRADDGILRVGYATYKTVVVPRMLTIRKSTLKLLEQFASTGGKVLFVTSAPERVDGVIDRSCAIFAKGKIVTDPVPELTERRLVSINDAKGNMIAPALYLLRHGNDFDALFVCNTSNKQNELTPTNLEPSMVRDRKVGFPKVKLELASAFSGALLELDAVSGRYYPVDAEYQNGKWLFTSSLPPLGSRLFLALDKKELFELSARPQLRKEVGKVELENIWQIRRNDKNLAVIDHFYHAVNDCGYGELEYVLAIDDALRKSLNLGMRDGNMVQPYLKSRKKGRNLSLKLKAFFHCSELPETSVMLAIEFPELYRIELNGQSVSTEDADGWYCDKSMRLIPLNLNSFRLGENVLELETIFNGAHPGLEAIFLVGDFGTEMKTPQITVLSGMPRFLAIGDWTLQGFTNYAGNLTYFQRVKPNLKPGEALHLEIGEWRGVALRITVDGVERAILPWPPYEVILTDIPAEFDLGIEVIGHRRNSHGPFYCQSAWPSWTGPDQFKEYKSSERNLVPCGLLTAPVLRIVK